MTMNLSSVVAAALAAATASMRSISARRVAAAAASHCSSLKEAHCSLVKEGPAGAACCSACGATDDCWEAMLLEPRCVGCVGVSVGAEVGLLGLALSCVAETSQPATLMITCVEFSNARAFTLSSAGSDCIGQRSELWAKRCTSELQDSAVLAVESQEESKYLERYIFFEAKSAR